jgi:DNA-binding MarR family transcriptional regulator
MLNRNCAPPADQAACMPPPSEPAHSGPAHSGPAYVLEDQIGHLLRRAHQRHTALFAEAFAEAGLTPTQWAALARLAAAGPATQNLLGRATAMDPATIQGVVCRLTGRGLVERNSDPTDRRHVKLALTPAGRACYERALAAAAAVTEATLAPLDPAARAVLMALLRRLA